MKFAIISAGEGSRLAQEGITLPKPLVRIQGTPIIERLVKLFCRHGAESVNIVINSKQPETRALLEELSVEFPINIVVKDTPSSMHSLYELSPLLRGGTFCLTTVDTIFREEDFARYLAMLEHKDNDGVMAVTPFIDDEKPLYVGTDDNDNITGFHDEWNAGCKYISGGIYGLSEKALDTLKRCIDSGQSRMRNFQRQLIADGLRLKACPFDKIVDIDHASDIEVAEKFLCKE
jgi:NDP-sugar pyrophosphorylase family protein